VASELPDVQHSMKPEVEIPIKQVGVQNVKTPIIIDSMYGGSHEVLSTISMSTDLRADMKGISMSMLTRTLTNYLEKPLKQGILKCILSDFKTAVETESEDSFIRFDFELPVSKKSPKSGFVFPQYYQCSFEGRMTGIDFRFFEKVIVQYASYCPCSASLCDHLEEGGNKGFPHAQRCFAEVLIEVLPGNIIWLEEIINLVEGAVKTIPYPILRRIDEQELARVAGLNQMFVEDAIRKISNELNLYSDYIKDWIVKCTHEESIHTSDAIAINWKGIDGGFNGTKFL